MGLPKDILRENHGLSDWCILQCWRGSIAHGTFRPSSEPDSIDDKDVLAVCVPPIDYYLGMKQYGSRGTKEIKRAEWDVVIYEAKKMIGLLAQGNPNVLSALWLEPQDYLLVTEAGQLLLDNRDLFVGKHVYRSFVGYGTSQLRRMEKSAKAMVRIKSFCESHAVPLDISLADIEAEVKRRNLRVSSK